MNCEQAKAMAETLKSQGFGNQLIWVVLLTPINAGEYYERPCAVEIEFRGVTMRITDDNILLWRKSGNCTVGHYARATGRNGAAIFASDVCAALGDYVCNVLEAAQ